MRYVVVVLLAFNVLYFGYNLVVANRAMAPITGLSVVSSNPEIQLLPSGQTSLAP